MAPKPPTSAQQHFMDALKHALQHHGATLTPLEQIGTMAQLSGNLTALHGMKVRDVIGHIMRHVNIGFQNAVGALGRKAQWLNSRRPSG